MIKYLSQILEHVKTEFYIDMLINERLGKERAKNGNDAITTIGKD